jgi:hypothetical protein
VVIMLNWRRTRAIVATAALAATVALSLPRAAHAHGSVYRGYRRGPVFVVGGNYGYAHPYWRYPYWRYPLGYHGFGWGPYWGPWGDYSVPEGGIDMSAAFTAGYGAVDLNVKPGSAEVWVDGKFVAEAKDLDGYPSYLWLPEGAHRVTVYKGGYARFEEEIEVQRGYRKALKVRLEKGESQPPGVRPGKKDPAEDEPAKKDPGEPY